MSEQLIIEDLPVPASLDGAAGADFAAIGRLLRNAAREELGHDELVTGDRAELARAQPSAYGRRVLQVARSGGGVGAEIIGAAIVALPLAENLDAADIELVVSTHWRRQGIGSRLLDRVAELCRREGRTILNGYAALSLASGHDVGDPVPGIAALFPDSGAGWVSAAAPSTAFATAHGFGLGQVERASRVDLDGGDAQLDRLEREALVASAGYETESWTGPVPDWAVEEYCRIIERMDTDPPMGGLEFEPSRWDATRLRTMEERRRRQGTASVVTVARHADSGRLVGYTELVVFEGQEGIAFQEGTLVLPEHRGHRLGQLVKARNQRALGRAQPRVGRIYTWNAAENGYMLRINEALGFRACHVEAAWTRK
ncbi:GNAT family N-acetyltransferase [Arthrobacter sp. JSM 101049]|uniref:GNAT family N-acetyltransferase n=1 Tax=Arthrobacter sp. JSM 101049 TaxID=929097 RepID=UPI003561FD72